MKESKLNKKPVKFVGWECLPRKKKKAAKKLLIRIENRLVWNKQKKY
jgi:hypothetical protein